MNLDAWTRRQFLRLAAVSISPWLVPSAMRAGESAAPVVMTVTGPIPAGQLGRTLPHEHVTTDFLGAERLPAPRYDRDRAEAEIQPHFEKLRGRGIATLVECTPAYIGRDVRLLRQISESTGIRIVTNTGYYGAVDNKYLPRHAIEESVEALASRWMAEWEHGIDGTEIRPGFLKLGTGNGPLSALHVKLLRAACRVHRNTGLTIAMHTGDGEAARDEVHVLTSEGVSPEALIWVHAQNDPGPVQVELARRGVWVSLDGYSVAHRNPDRYRNFLSVLKSEGLLGRVLVSHDDGWAVEGEAAAGSALKLFGNGNPQPYTSLFDRFFPDLKASGFTEADLQRLTVLNPCEAFGIRHRLLG